MPKNLFSALIDSDVSNARRIWHSTTDYFKSIDRKSFSKSSVASQTVSAASNFGGVAGGVAGGITIGLSSAAAGGLAGAGFLAAVAGPQVAVTAAVVGVALLVKGTYSNREDAHKTLTKKYVWNLIDDTPPAHGQMFTAESLEDAANAATTLLDDGKNQMKLLGTKLQTAQQKFKAVAERFERHLTTADFLRSNWHSTSMMARRNKMRDQYHDVYREALSLWEKETDSGGAIFEYVRRCSHTGNYLQAPHILSLALKEKIDPGSVVGKKQPDFFAGMALATNSRGAFAALDTGLRSLFKVLHG